MEYLGMFLVAVAIIAIIAYVVIWALATDYFLKAGTTDLDVWKAVIAAIIFAVVVILLLYWARQSAYDWMEM